MGGVLTFDEARALTDVLKAKLMEIAPLIHRAYSGQAYKALGYADWQQYCDRELGGGIALPVADRRAAVVELVESGVSKHAIAPALGVSRATVVNDSRSGGQELTPCKIEGQDGKHYTPPAPKPGWKCGDPDTGITVRTRLIATKRGLWTLLDPKWYTLNAQERRTLRDICSEIIEALDAVEEN